MIVPLLGSLWCRPTMSAVQSVPSQPTTTSERGCTRRDPDYRGMHGAREACAPCCQDWLQRADSDAGAAIPALACAAWVGLPLCNYGGSRFGSGSRSPGSRPRFCSRASDSGKERWGPKPGSSSALSPVLWYRLIYYAWGVNLSLLISDARWCYGDCNLLVTFLSHPYFCCSNNLCEQSVYHSTALKPAQLQ